MTFKAVSVRLNTRVNSKSVRFLNTIHKISIRFAPIQHLIISIRHITAVTSIRPLRRPHTQGKTNESTWERITVSPHTWNCTCTTRASQTADSIHQSHQPYHSTKTYAIFLRLPDKRTYCHRRLQLQAIRPSYDLDTVRSKVDLEEVDNGQQSTARTDYCPRRNTSSLDNRL